MCVCFNLELLAFSLGDYFTLWLLFFYEHSFVVVVASVLVCISLFLRYKFWDDSGSCLGSAYLTLDGKNVRAEGGLYRRGKTKS